ncbi:MAG: S-layer protein [Candidatus Aenigmarchaeota archaeon]|nr:S-layer protein [Candidatus Aenigmarchaeota archaeon]
MEIKRVIAGGLATVAAGATLALGAGAVTLGDFVTVSGNTMTSPYIVIGGNAAAEDTLAAADIGVALGGQATQTVSVSGSMAEMSVSNGALVKTKSNYLYFGDALSSIKSKFTYDDLPVLLASGTLKQDDGNSVDYTQRLYPGAQTVAFSVNNNAVDDWAVPKLHVQLTDGANLYTYEVRFSPALDTAELGDVEITLLGTDYVFSDVASANTGEKLTLYASSQTETLIPGDVVTVTTGGLDYTVELVAVDADNDEAVIKINGAADTYTEGEDIEEGDFEAYVKTIFGSTSYSYVSLFIGSQSMVLADPAGAGTTEVEIGGTGVDGSTVAITNTTTTISKLEVAYAMDDDVVLEAGDSFTDPVFGTFKLAFGGLYPGLEDASKDLISFVPSSDELEISFANLDGIEYEEVLTVYDSGFELTADGTDKINFINNATIGEDEYVVVTDNDEYSYILKSNGKNTDDEIILEDVSTGNQYTVTASDIGYDLAIGSLDVEVTYFNLATESVALNNTGAAINTLAWIVTKNGAAFAPYINTSTPTAGGEASQAFLAAAFNVTEDISAAFDETAVAVSTFTVTLGGTTDITTDTSYSEIAADSDLNEKMWVTAAGTYIDIKNTDDQDTTYLYIPDEPTPAYVAFGSNPAFAAGEGAAAGTVEQAVQIQNSISKMESEVNTATLAKDLLLLGGPCANGLVAELLEMSATNPACATEFTAEYPTEGVITVVEDAFGSGQKALIVAGVDRAQTRNLAVKVMQGTLDYSA